MIGENGGMKDRENEKRVIRKRKCKIQKHQTESDMHWRSKIWSNFRYLKLTFTRIRFTGNTNLAY